MTMLTKAEWDTLTPDEQWRRFDDLQFTGAARDARIADDHLRKQLKRTGIKTGGQPRDEETERGVIQRLQENGFPLIADFREQRLKSAQVSDDDENMTWETGW